MSDSELQKMVRGFRVSDLQSLLSYAGRNKGGKKYDLQNRALDLIKLHSASIDMKIRELHMNRYQQSRGHPETQDMYPLAPISEPMGANFGGAPSHQGPVGGGVGIPGYVPSINKQLMRPVPNLNMIPPYAVNPDVKFKDLPFYDVLSEVLRPTSLVPLPNERFQERDFVFYFTRQQIMELESSPDVQVQLRVCLLETSCEQADDFPSSILIKINGKLANLPNPIPTNKPGIEAKRPRRPVDITNVCKRATAEANDINISWASSNGRPYVVAIFLVRKQSASVLIRRLKAIGVRNPDHTTAMIKEKLCQDRDSEIATMSLRGSLICPLGKIKMKLPCRALTCTHLQCFDATLYVQMNEKKPKWICPVCDKPALFKSLAIDGLFLDITSKAPPECTEIQFHEDGSWTPIMPVKKAPEISDTSLEAPPPKEGMKQPKKPVEIISLDSGSDTEDSWPIPHPPKKKPYKPVGIISPVLLESPENSQLSAAPFSPLDPCSSQSEPSTSKPSTSSENASLLPPTLNIETDVSCILSNPSPLINLPNSPTYSPASPSPQPFCPPPASTFPDTLDLLGGPPTTTGQCFSNFDLYSLIQQNHEDSFRFSPSVVEEDASPDVISID